MSDTYGPTGISSSGRHAALHRNCLLGNVGEGRVELADLLIKKGTDVSLPIADDDLTPLILACQSGNEFLVAFLVRNGADVNLLGDGTSPLIQAVYSGHKNVVQLLVSCGADVKVKDIHGQTAKAIAEDYEQRDIVSVLCQGN